MTPELANKLLREHGWDWNVVYYASEADCPHCKERMDRGQVTDGTQRWYWYCKNDHCVAEHHGGWRGWCKPPEEGEIEDE